jgi:hypothetical protein
MNVIRLCGGLGNQLFQYAFGKAQQVNGIDVQFDLSWYNKGYTPIRLYRLDKFNTELTIGNLIKNQKIIKEKGFNLNLLKIDKCNFLGYWQYLPYLKEVLSILKKEIWIKKEFYTDQFCILKERITINDSIGVHVRRGDYLNKGWRVIPFNYYLEAISKLKGDLFIFSDDIEWCTEHFKSSYFNREVTFINEEDFIEFELLKLCKHIITANSTFSWWAALLNENANKVIITPKEWWLEKVNQDNMNRFGFLLNDWIKI